MIVEFDKEGFCNLILFRRSINDKYQFMIEEYKSIYPISHKFRKGIKNNLEFRVYSYYCSHLWHFNREKATYFNLDVDNAFIELIKEKKEL